MCKLFVEKYKDLSDFKLIELVQQNDKQAFNILFSKHLPLIKTIVSNHLQNPSDFEDALQDAAISFYYATILYDFTSSSFKTYFSLCIERGMVASFKKNFAKKRIPQDMLVSLNENDIFSKDESPENLFILKEESASLINNIRAKLSKLENEVLTCFIETGSYNDTAKILSISRKSVDNALLRVRHKIDNLINND